MIHTIPTGNPVIEPLDGRGAGPTERVGALAPQEVQNVRLAQQVEPITVSPLTIALATLGALSGAYHGTRRNRGSAAWGLVWGLAGAVAPILTTGIAVAQGYGDPKETP